MCVGKPPASVRPDRSCQEIPKIDGSHKWACGGDHPKGKEPAVTTMLLIRVEIVRTFNKQHFVTACRGAACQAMRTPMGAVNPPNDQGEFTIDFRSTPPIRTLAFKERLGLGGIALLRGSSEPIEGLRVRSSQVTVAIHESETFRMDWRSADSDRLRSSEIAYGDAHVGDGRLPFWVRSQASSSFFAVAIDAAFVRQIWETEFGRTGDFELKIAIGVRDLVIDRIGLLGRKELGEGGIGGRLYAESLGTALAVHLLRQYSTSPTAQVIHKGGLAAKPLQRIIEYIHEHLQEELSLFELARTAKLSPHYFATAFKASMGISPHRYVIEQRIDRARDLLRRGDKTISEIAYAVGFSSQSHLTVNFRRTMGVTPRKFRQSLD
jgi:AraC family transcriptional regulator